MTARGRMKPEARVFEMTEEVYIIFEKVYIIFLLEQMIWKLNTISIDKRLVNSVKYHYSSLRLLWSLFTCKSFENKRKNKHKVQIKLSKVQTCMTWPCFLFANAVTVLTLDFEMAFWSARVIQGKSTTWLVNSALNCTWKPISRSSLRDSYDIGFRVQFVCVIRWWLVKLGNNFTRVLSKSL